MSRLKTRVGSQGFSAEGLTMSQSTNPRLGSDVALVNLKTAVSLIMPCLMVYSPQPYALAAW